MLGYILGLLKGFKYLRKTGDLIGDNLTLRLLRRTLVLEAPCKSTEDAENKLRGLILTVGNKVRKSIRNFKPLAIFCRCTVWFMWDLVGNPEDRFSQNEAHFYLFLFEGVPLHLGA